MAHLEPQRRTTAAPPDPQSALGQATALGRLLGIVQHDDRGRAISASRLDGYAQDATHAYRLPRRINVAGLSSHLIGDITLAIACADHNGMARVAAWDLDRLGPVRARILFDELERRNLADAAIATSGSDDDRSKVIVFFDAAQPSLAIHDLAKEILAEARRSPSWSPEGANDVEIRPTLGKGGLLRICGRNPKRGGPIEVTYHPLTGEPRTFASVVPAVRHFARVAQPVAVAKRGAWVAEAIEKSVDYRNGGTAGVMRLVGRLAHEAIRMHPYDLLAARTDFADLIRALKATSPDLEFASPKTGDLRNPLDRVDGAFEKALREKIKANKTLNSINSQAVTLHSPGRERSSLCNVTALEAMGDFVRRRGLNPLAFSISYRELGRAIGAHPMQVLREIDALVEAGFVVRHYRGVPSGPRNIKTVYGIPALAGGLDACLREGEAHHLTIEMRRRGDKWLADRAAANNAKIIDFPLQEDPAPPREVTVVVRKVRTERRSERDRLKYEPTGATAPEADLLAYARERLSEPSVGVFPIRNSKNDGSTVVADGKDYSKSTDTNAISRGIEAPKLFEIDIPGASGKGVDTNYDDYPIGFRKG